VRRLGPPGVLKREGRGRASAATARTGSMLTGQSGWRRGHGKNNDGVTQGCASRVTGSGRGLWQEDRAGEGRSTMEEDAE
jgi:hypothetical protein